MYETLNSRDRWVLALCIAVFAVGITIGIRYFDRAFPEASIDFRLDRSSSRVVAQDHLRFLALQPAGFTHAAAFDHDNESKVFLERKLGLEEANKVMAGEVKIWFWRHRWFKPLEREEFRVDVAPSGELVSFAHTIPEEAAVAPAAPDLVQKIAERYLGAVGVNAAALHLVSSSERRLPNRTEQILTWESKSVRPGGAPYRYTVTMRGTTVASYQRELRVPEEWLRSYQELRSKNVAAGVVDQLLMFLTIVAAAIVFVRRMKQGDLNLRFALWSAGIAAILVSAVGLNSYSSYLADFDTTESFSSFLINFFFGSIMEGFTSGLLLMIMVGAGEALYRQHYPKLVAVPSLFQRSALGSKRVFFGFVIGYALFAAFLAYQVVFYIVAERFGAWSPADVPYDDILNTTFPWLAVLFMGFYPAMSEEFMSRAFSIPFFEKIFKHRFTAILIAGFIWGFGHATYPNQPFYIRGLEVGIAGVVIGLLMIRFGLLPLLVWHYTVDALYTSFLMLKSGNSYYMVSSAMASLIFTIPLIVSVVGYFRRGGFIPDENLENQAIGTVEPPPEEAIPEVVGTLPPPPPRLALTIAAIVLAAAGILGWYASSRPSHREVINYKISEAEARDIATRHLAVHGYRNLPERTIVIPVGGFRSWTGGGPEDGGMPQGYDAVAAEYVTRHAEDAQGTLLKLERNYVPAATYTVRFYEPQQKEEFLVEVDPRKRVALGFHRFVDETAAGARIERSAAEQIGAATVARYGYALQHFALKEALNFEHPSRRDWLLHYEERKPLAAEAYRRLHVRIAGDRATQFTKTIKIPEREERAASEQTIVNTLLMLARFAGFILLAALVVGGCVVIARGRRLEWKWAARRAAPFVLLAVAALATRWETFIASYDTSIGWQTFLVMTSVSIAALLLVSIGGLIIALAILRAAHPEAPLYFHREGRARFGSDAVTRALTALGVIAISTSFGTIIASLAPRYFSLDALDPSAVATASLPIVAAIWNTVSQTLFATTIVVALAALMRDSDDRWARRVMGMAIAGFFLFALDPAVRPHQLAASIGAAIVATLIFWLLFFVILPGNRIAPTIFFAMALSLRHGMELWRHDRGDLRVQAVIFTVLVLGALSLLFAKPPTRRDAQCASGTLS